jgi:hypothetical protein
LDRYVEKHSTGEMPQSCGDPPFSLMNNGKRHSSEAEKHHANQNKLGCRLEDPSRYRRTIIRAS